MVATEITLEVDVVDFGLGREVAVVLVSQRLLLSIGAALALRRDVPESLVKLVLEHLQCLDGVLD